MTRDYLFILGMLLSSAIAQAQMPTVTTDMRFARGATMAFGRIAKLNANGATIKDQGFCYAEQPEPTIDDNRHASTLSNSGTIYWMKDLKPATKYYMRAYATTSDGQTAYGETIKFYTFPKGQINLSVREGGDDATYKRIKNASETAAYWWTNLTEIKGFSPSVGFVDGTPTADCSYGGWVRVGSNQSYQRCGTILHEWLHGIGVIPWADTEWARFNLRSGTSNAAGFTTGSGQWLGDRVTEVLRFLDNSETEVLNGDYQHMWPYGINGASEDNGSDLLYIGNSLICQALGEDGLQHTYSLFAEPYYALQQEDNVKVYIRNESESRGRYTSFLVTTKSGALRWKEMTESEALENDSAAWLTTFTPENQYYQFQNVATGRYLSSSGSTFNTVSRTTPSANEDLHLMKGRVDVDGQRGYWIIHPTGNWTPNCLQANANGATGSSTFDIANSAETQRWLILDAEQVKAMQTVAIEKYRSKLADLLKDVKALSRVGHTETIAGSDDALNAAISDIEAKAAEAESIGAIMQLFDEARAAAIEYLKGVVATRESLPFKLNFLLSDPTLANDAEGWSQKPGSINYGCGEFYETAFDFNQTVAGLPAGTYQFTVKAFQRPGASSECYKNEVTAQVYAGESSAPMIHIKEGARSDNLGGTVVEVEGKNIPNDMEAASLYFKKANKYLNKVKTEVEADNSSLKIGLRAESMPSKYWVIFSDFGLNFLGDKTKTGIRSIDNTPSSTTDCIYTLDGRRLPANVSLRSGVYIKDGKKIVVK